MTCKHCGQPSPEEFYKKAMELGDGKLFSIFGRTAKEILRALHFYDMRTLTDYQEPDWWPEGKPRYVRIRNEDGTEKYIKIMEKSKMTREEALEKTGFIIHNKDVIATLEALGLLKFEEKKQTDKEWTAQLVVRAALQDACAANFGGAKWNDDIALKFAKTAIDAYKNYMYEGA